MSAPIAADKLRIYNVGPVKPWVQAAADFLGSMFNVKTIGGWRKTDPFPDHPSGHALDFMVDIPTGNALAEYAIANYQTLGIKYIIHDHRVWNPKQGWHPYTSTTNPHTDHVHITFNDTPSAAFMNGTALGGALGSGVGLTDVAQGADDDTCAWAIKSSLVNTCVFRKTAVRGMLGGLYVTTAVTIGLVAAIILVYAAKETEPGNAVSKSVSAVTRTVMLVAR